MPTRSLLGALALLLLTTPASAQTPPSAAQISADVRANIAPNATVTLRGNGSRQLNGGVYEFVHSITARYPSSEMAGVEIEGYHDVVYQSHGSRYVFDRVRVGDWRYFGLPAPSDGETLALLESKPADGYPFGTLDLPRSVEVIEGAELHWHNLTSVTVPIRLRYTKYGTGNVRHELADFEWETEVRLYREAPADPWDRFLLGGFASEAVEVGRRPGEAGLRTVAEAGEVAEREHYASALPQVSVPAFSSGMEMVRFLYTALRDAPDRATAEATLRALLSPSYFAEGSETALSDWAEIEVLPGLLGALYDGPSRFADQFCEAPDIDQERTSDRRVYIRRVLDRPPRGTHMSWGMEVAVAQTSGGYRNGRPLPGAWKVESLSIHLSDDPDDLAWIASFDDPSSLCTASGRAVQAATGNVEGAADGATDRARGAVDGAVQEGRRRLGRIFGRGGN